MELERKHLLLLFALGVVSKGFVKVRFPSCILPHTFSLFPNPLARRQSAFGANASLVLLLSVALYYWRARRRSDTVYDDIARRQAEAAAKIDQLHGIGDGTVSEMDLRVRKTQFRLRPDDASIITCVSPTWCCEFALSNSHPLARLHIDRDRMHKYSRKFSGSLAERRKFLAKRKPRAAEDDEKLPAAGEVCASAAPQRKSGKTALESAVEAAVDDTL